MPQGRITWLDRAKMVGNDLAVGLIEENLNVNPEIDELFARNIDGTSYDTAIRIGLPSTGFRGLNKGIAASKSEIDKRKVECFIFGGRVEIDKAAYAAAKQVGQTDLEVEATEASGVALSSKISIGTQIFYGAPGANDSGFPGLRGLLPKTGSLVVDAGGTTANTGSSVFAIKTGLKDVALVLGNGDVFSLGDFRDETLYDDEQKPFPGRVADLCGYVGLQVPHKNCVGRIGNLTAQAGKGCTDDLMSELYSRFPVGSKPDFFVISRRSARQLQKDRGTAIVVNVGPGAGLTGNVAKAAPTPLMSADGVPIIISDSIVDNEAIEA